MENIKCGKYESPSVTLVRGYLYDYPMPDGIGRDWHKFEIIQHTCLADKITQTSFDYDLSIEIIKGIIDFFPSHAYIVEMDSGVKINSFENYCQYMFQQKKTDEHPMEDAALDWPDRFSIWNSEGKVVLHGRLQAWNIWGGDYPYHDAFSYEFYFEEDNAVALQNHYMDIFIKKQIFIHEILCGYLHKRQIRENSIQKFWTGLGRKRRIFR